MNWHKSIYQEATPFQRTALWALGFTFFLIFIGGLVRASGAGLGCPDWPRCFGLWFPPLHADALPAGYDRALFNPINTWLEYFNRLVGVTVGLFILATFIRAVRLARTDTAVFAGATAALLLVLFQGWLGGQVVRSGLTSWMLTIHMVVAIVILNTLLYTAFRSMRDRLRVELEPATRQRAQAVIGVLLLVTLVQIIFGAQVREALSEIARAHADTPRAEWLGQVGTMDLIHRSFSWIVLAGALFWYRVARTLPSGHPLRDLAALHTSVVVVQILLGAGLAYLGLPPVLQIFHLVLASLMSAVQFLGWLLTRDARRV